MTRKKVLYGILIFLLLVIAGGAVFLSTLLPIITGYAAKNLCSAVFVSGRAPIVVESMDLNFSFIKFTHNKVDLEEKTVKSRFLWGRSKAIYRDGFGVTLLRDVREKELRKISFPDLPEPGYRQDTIAWPMGDLIPDSVNTGIDRIALNAVASRIISDNGYGGNAFAYEQLFDRIGIDDAVFEVDPEGRFVGSSYLYATARDYARFALLFQDDGVFNGKRILPEGWVKYARTPASASNGEYGALFWLNECKKLPSAPANVYMCVGHDGQRIFLLPDEELIVVVLGNSPTSRGGMDFDRLLKDITGAL